MSDNNGEKKNRNLQIYVMRKYGIQFKMIGKKFGITPERVRQICAKEHLLEKRYVEMKKKMKREPVW